MFKLIIVFVFLSLYAHLYLHFIVNPNNEYTIVEDINKEDITNSVYVKEPFIFDSSLLRKELVLKKETPHLTLCKEIEVHDMSYVSFPVLEPYVRFSAKRTIHHFIKKKKWLDTNNSCRTFYRFHQGTFHVSCIHPKYKELVSSKQLKDHPKMIHLTLHQDSCLFLPAYWYVQIIPVKKDSLVDKIQYFTPLNKVANAISKIIQ